MWNKQLTSRTLILLTSTALLGSAQFRVSVQVAVVDVTVVDSRGYPVPGLGPKDFNVTVDRQPSSVLTVEYVHFDYSPRSSDRGLPAAGAPRSAEGTRTPGSRTLVFLFDDLSFKPQPSKALGISLERLLELIDPQDRLGLATTSGLGPTVTPTLERAPVRAALTRLAGRRDDSTAPFFVGIDEALALESRANTTNLVSRECRILELGGGCGHQVLGAARRQATVAVHRTEDQVQAIRSTIEWVKDSPEPRVMILLSAGIAADARHDLRQQVRSLSEAAAEAAVQLYALTDTADGSDVSDVTAERAEARRSEARFLNQGVQTFAAASGGESFVVVGQPDRFLQRILMETGGIYRLAVEVSQSSTVASKFLDVKVRVNRRGTTVRARHRALRQGPVTRIERS